MDPYEEALAPGMRDLYKKYRDMTPEENIADRIHTVTRLKTDAHGLLVETTDPKRRAILEMMIENYDSHIAELAQTIKS